MVITHHGGQCFKVTFGDLTLVFDPIWKGGTLPAVRFGADVALISCSHPDMNGAAEVAYGDKQPFIVSGPGEYERGGVTVQGFLTKSRYGLAKGQTEAVNTIYAVELEGMTLVHLGALSETELPKEARESIDEVDVLFVRSGETACSPPRKRGSSRPPLSRTSSCRCIGAAWEIRKLSNAS